MSYQTMEDVKEALSSRLWIVLKIDEISKRNAPPSTRRTENNRHREVMIVVIPDTGHDTIAKIEYCDRSEYSDKMYYWVKCNRED